MMVRKPSRRPTAAKTRSIEAASTISGATVGIVIRPSRSPWRRKRWRWKARVAAVAAAVATTVVAKATTRLLRSEERISGLVAAFTYQSRVKPPHEADSRLRLKERAESTAMGA
jgi:hypothetical protein